MHSPLPDASALEAGIVEDDQPTRSSRVQDNVRNLLRASVISSIRGSSFGIPGLHQPTVEEEPRSPLQSPLQRHLSVQNHALPSPSSGTTISTISTEVGDVPVPGLLYPPVAYQQQIQEMAHQSALFNTRAVAALNHPDLSDPSLAVFLQQKTEDRQRRAWKRSRNKKSRRANGRQKQSSWLLCLFAGLLLTSVVATYLVLATSQSDLSTTFHVLFILGILLATIVFVHTLVRVCLFNPRIPDSPRVYVISKGRWKHRHRHREGSESQSRHHHHHHRRHQETPSFPEECADYVPPTPIPVHMPADEVRPDSREAEPSAGAERASRAWDKDVEAVLPNPPPAYGRWRGSVRANPDLLHWQPLPSPVDSDTPALPSPTYAEAMRTQQGTGPPSYVTRESPARRREMQSARPGIAQAQTAEQEVLPEMVEARGAGE